MKNKIEINISESIDLDQIVCLILDKAVANPKLSNFDFTKKHDNNVMTQIKKYSLGIKDKDLSQMNDPQLEEMVEESSAELFDSIVQANFDYYKHGMKAGARLLLELII